MEAKRARTSLGRRDWANLAEGPAGLIADRVLANDVADYVRFRAVCRPWRRCAPEPLAHHSLDRRFHPRRWKILRGRLAGAPHRLRFLNSSTGECIRVHVPELRHHDVLAFTPEGLLILLLHGCTHVSLLNPLTRHHLTDLPPLTELLPPEQHYKLSHRRDLGFHTDFRAYGSGIADDDSTVVLCFSTLRMLGLAKPGDERWTLLKFSNRLTTAPLMLAGRFYCVTQDGLMVLVSNFDQPPRLEVAAELPMGVSAKSDSMHLLDNAGELMLVHRRYRRRGRGKNFWRRRYDAYRVHLDTGRFSRVKSLGGEGRRALFIGMHCSLSVLTEVFPSGSIASDTIYLSFDINERAETEAYHLADRSVEPAKYNLDGTVVQPCTVVDCLSLCNTVEHRDFLSSVF